MGPNTDNSNYLDVYMEGTAEGWMAVGFSENRMMVSSIFCYTKHFPTQKHINYSIYQP